MILDHLSECEPYRRLSENFAAGFDYLRATAFETVADGRYSIRGEEIIAMVQSYNTKPLAEGRWEAHRHFADIQYIVSGSERMGIAPISSLSIEEPYTREKDVEFFVGTGQFVRVDRGSFTIFLPHDAHMPGIAVDTPAPVKKVVMKIRL